MRRGFKVFCALALWLCLGFLSVSCGSTASDLGLYARAVAAYQARDYRQAAELASAQLQALPRHALERYPVLLLRARSFMLLDQKDEARADFARALRERPGSTEAKLNLARLALEDGQVAEARRLLRELLCDDPEDLRALRLSALLELDAGEVPAALASLERAIEAGGELALAYLERSRLRFLMEDDPGARSDLERSRVLCSGEGALALRIDAVVRELDAGSAHD